jgi:hypothetical protein
MARIIGSCHVEIVLSGLGDFGDGTPADAERVELVEGLEIS